MIWKTIPITWRKKMELDTRYARAWIYLCGFDFALLALVELCRFLGNDMNGIAPSIAIVLAVFGLVFSAFTARSVGNGNDVNSGN